MATNTEAFNKFPVLILNKDYYLRKPRVSDAERYKAYISHPSVRDFIPDSCIPATLAHAQRDMQYIINLFDNKRSFYWVIARRDTDELIGTCGFENWNQFHRRLELAYDTDPAYWRQGISTMALKAIFHFVFRELNAYRVEAFVLPSNEPSIRLLEDKIGFKPDGILRQYRYYKKKQVDVLLLGFTREYYIIKISSCFKRAMFRLRG